MAFVQNLNAVTHNMKLEKDVKDLHATVVFHVLQVTNVQQQAVLVKKHVQLVTQQLKKDVKNANVVYLLQLLNPQKQQKNLILQKQLKPQN